MRTYIILLLLSCISSWNVMAQEKIEFDKLIIDNSVSLSIKENPIRPTNDMHIIFIDQKYGTMVLRDFQRLLKDEFPNVGDEEYAYLKECFW